MTAILGLSAFYHDSAAVLVLDGRIVAAAQEERFSRRKHDYRFPENAVAYCLREGGLTPADLDFVGFYDKPLAKFERLLSTYVSQAPKGIRSYLKALPLWLKAKLHLPRELDAALQGGFRGRYIFADHHESHAASAFFPSPFEEAAILTIDGVGEWSTTTLGVGRGHRLQLTHEIRFPHSLGLLYSAFTQYAGFRVNSGEYKLMGLAPYGEPRYVDTILQHLIRVRADGSFWMDQRYFDYCAGTAMTSAAFHQLFGGAPRQPDSPITQREMDLAASVQAVCEEVMLRCARHLQAITGQRRLVMAGGVALNCVGNGRILREGPFDDIWVQPAAGDAGGALGVAELIWHHVLDQPRGGGPSDHMSGALLGPRVSASEIQSTLDAAGAVYEVIEDEAALLERVVDLLLEEQVVGWFQDRMEFGPRALGARSILGDPRSPRMQQMMNLKIKFRESFRPFAPSVLRECTAEYFDVPPTFSSPYMLVVAPVTEGQRTPGSGDRMRGLAGIDRLGVPRSSIPAVTHVDYSARIQTVTPEANGRYYRLLRRFHERSGCPVLINTSFNIRGEPIVCSVEDAYRCFLGTGMDVLVIEHALLLKQQQRARSGFDAEAYRLSFRPD